MVFRDVEKNFHEYPKLTAYAFSQKMNNSPEIVQTSKKLTALSGVLLYIP
jgi:hypothetical protein